MSKVRQCNECEWHRNTVWFYEGIELSTDKCTLGNTCFAHECKDFHYLIPEDTYAGSLSYSRKVQEIFPVPIPMEE